MASGIPGRPGPVPTSMKFSTGDVRKDSETIEKMQRNHLLRFANSREVIGAIPSNQKLTIIEKLSEPDEDCTQTQFFKTALKLLLAVPGSDFKLRDMFFQLHNQQ